MEESRINNDELVDVLKNIEEGITNIHLGIDLIIKMLESKKQDRKEYESYVETESGIKIKRREEEQI